jgi:hypothetical protein
MTRLSLLTKKIVRALMAQLKTSQLDVVAVKPNTIAVARLCNLSAMKPNALVRGSGQSRYKINEGKSQNLVWPLLPKILCLCLSDLPNFLQKGLKNYSSLMLAGVKLPLFCQFWQQQHVPQIRQWVSCLRTIIVSPVRLLCPNLGNAMIEVGTKRFFI